MRTYCKRSYKMLQSRHLLPQVLRRQNSYVMSFWLLPLFVMLTVWWVVQGLTTDPEMLHTSGPVDSCTCYEDQRSARSGTPHTPKRA
jgi:hypothetical protein